MHAFIHTHILFGIEAYANTYYTHLQKLHRLNYKLIKILLNKDAESSLTDLYKQMGALPIVKLHEYQIVLFVKKTLHDKSAVPDIFHDYYRNASSVHRQNTRSS